jgi:hypothetical protein
MHTEMDRASFCDFVKDQWSNTTINEKIFGNFSSKNERIKNSISEALLVEDFCSKTYIYFLGDDKDDRFPSHSLELVSEDNDFFIQVEIDTSFLTVASPTIQDFMINYLITNSLDIVDDKYLIGKIEQINQAYSLCVEIISFLEFLDYFKRTEEDRRCKYDK